MNARELVDRGRRVLRMEREAIEAMEGRLDDGFARAVELIASRGGRVIVTGLGKSGLIARKVAATLTSTGTAASFLHPVEGLHGDLGIVSADDVAIIISKSGETPELFPLVEQLKGLGVCLIALSGEKDSMLCRHADVVLDTAVAEEACPHDLAPTTSTTAALAMGDALAIALLERKGFRREDFARLHPGGALGKRLLTRVRDVMVTDNVPVLPPTATMRDTIPLIGHGRGTVAIVDGDRRVLGVITGGDLTRLMNREERFLDVCVDAVMNHVPKVAHAEELGSAAGYRMQAFRVMALPVLDTDERLVGMVHLHDLMRAGVA